jgi:uncharacterized membrane protein
MDLPIDEPAALARWLPRGVAVLGAALGGLGLILWVAANWAQFGRFGRFALLEATLLAMASGAAFLPRARVPLGLVALLAIGGLFAYFGQTYQTGADPWQLFALWAALSVPLALALRSDVLWAPWVLVAMSAITLWIHAHAGHAWQLRSSDLPVHLAGWAAAWALAAALGEPTRRFTGAGIWSFRAALVFAAWGVTLTAVGALFGQRVAPHFAAGVVTLALAAAGLASRRFFDLFGLSAVALGLNALAVGRLARWLLDDRRDGEFVVPLLVLGLVAAALLAATVHGVMRIARARTGASQ